MKILLLGRNGQVGWELHRAMQSLGEVDAPGREELDLSDEGALRRKLYGLAPDLIVNAAAYNDVERAEDEDSHIAQWINGEVPGMLARMAAELDGALIHYSTDYVFDGRQISPYTEDDAPSPLNRYGRTKLDGESNIGKSGAPHLIFRTSWVYGARRKNFALSVIDRMKRGGELRVVDDQFGAPTWSRTVAEVTARVVAQGAGAGAIADFIAGRSGVYHLSCGGRTTWFHFASEILRTYQARTGDFRSSIRPISSEDYGSKARRPRNSVLSNDKLFDEFGLTAPAWDDAFQLVCDDLYR